MEEENLTINSEEKKELEFLLSLDFGTTAIKVGLFSPSGALFRMESREQPLLFPDHGKVEQSPKGSWETMVGTVRHLMKGLSPSSVSCISLSTIIDCLLEITIIFIAVLGAPR